MIDFTDLDDLDTAAVKQPREKVKFKCTACAGTGIWRGGYMNPTSGKCHACNGRGYFHTSPEQRVNARERKKAKLVETKLAFQKEHGELIEALAAMMDWNDFARSLIEGFHKYGSLSERQIESAQKMLAKMAQREEERKRSDSRRPTIDLTKIHELFANAKSNGLKKPVLRVGALKISVAPVNGKNAGCLYVTDDGEYAGKIDKDGKFFAMRSARENIVEDLMELAKDPKGMAVLHGRKTGQCACCGRELTNKESIELGIGPICLGKWGL